MKAVQKVVGRDGESPVPQVWDVISEEDRGKYLEALRDGKGLDIAAREIGYTATRMRRFSNRDATWRDLVQAAYAEGQEHYRDLLRDASRTRALEVSDRMLEVELGTHVPGYEHLRRNRLQLDANVSGQVVVLNLDPAHLDSLSEEQLAQAEAALALLGGEIIDGEAEELP